MNILETLTPSEILNASIGLLTLIFTILPYIEGKIKKSNKNKTKTIIHIHHHHCNCCSNCKKRKRR